MLVPLRQMLYPHYIAGEFADYGTLGELKRQIPKREEEEVAPVIKHLVQVAIETKEEKEENLELMLRLKLEQEGIIFKLIYLKLLMCQIDMRKRNAAIFLLLLH